MCASKVFIVTTAYNGLSLADITALNFTMSTDPTATNPRNFYVNVYVDQTGTGANHTHRLDFAPPNGTSVANLFTDPYWRINGAVPSRNWADTLTALGGNPRIAPAPWNDPAAAAFRVSTGDTGTNYVGHKGTFSAFTIVAPASNINDSFDFANLGAISGDACGNPPNRGALQITQSTVGYQSPAGGIIRLANGAPLEVFNDAGGDGFDEFIIARSAVVDDVTWYGLFLGSCDLVWVPETAGTRVR
jgi:hypothetical protein